MGFIHRVSGSVHYGISETSRKMQEIAHNPSSVRKVLQLVIKLFAAADLYREGSIQRRGVTEAMSGAIGIIDFYRSFENILFWIHPFSKDSMDREGLLKSIEENVGDATVASQLVSQVMKKEAYCGKQEVRQIVADFLEQERAMDREAAHALAEKIDVRQIPRSWSQLLEKAFFTVANAGNNVMTLQKWGVVKWSQVAASVGSQSSSVSIAARCMPGNIGEVLAGVGALVSFGTASYCFFKSDTACTTTKGSGHEDATHWPSKKLLWNVVAAGTELIAVGTPLLFTLNLPTILALAIVAKSTAVLVILVL